MPKLNSRICNNSKLTENTKVRVLSGLHSQFPPLRQQDMDHLRNAAKRLNSLHLRCLRRILHIHWQGRITNRVRAWRKILKLKFEYTWSQNKRGCQGNKRYPPHKTLPESQGPRSRGDRGAGAPPPPPHTHTHNIFKIIKN